MRGEGQVVGLCKGRVQQPACVRAHGHTLRCASSSRARTAACVAPLPQHPCSCHPSPPRPLPHPSPACPRPPHLHGVGRPHRLRRHHPRVHAPVQQHGAAGLRSERDLAVRSGGWWGGGSGRVCEGLRCCPGPCCVRQGGRDTLAHASVKGGWAEVGGRRQQEAASRTGSARPREGQPTHLVPAARPHHLHRQAGVVPARRNSGYSSRWAHGCARVDAAEAGR